MSRLVPLICLAVMHAIVDACALFIEPLWPDLRVAYHLSETQLLALFSVTAVAPNFSQVVFGYVGDRFGSRYLLWLGPTVAAVCLGCVGLAPDVLFLGILLMLGYVGVGSFHPEGAVAAGAAIPEQRTRSLSLFMLGGTLGQGVGPMLVGNMVKEWGLASLLWLAAPTLAIVMVIHLVSVRFQPPRQIVAVAGPRSFRGIWSGRGKLAFFLLLVCTLRVVPNAGMTKAIAFTLEARGYESDVIGNTQSMFLVSGSVGMLLIASRFRQEWTRGTMILSPLVAAPLLLGLSSAHCPYWLMAVLLVANGIILNGTTPVVVSYAHQLFPKGAGIASAITMGVSWGIGGLLVAKLTTQFDEMGRPELLYAAFVPCALASAAGAWFLPFAGHRHAAYVALNESESKPLDV